MFTVKFKVLVALMLLFILAGLAANQFLLGKRVNNLENKVAPVSVVKEFVVTASPSATLAPTKPVFHSPLRSVAPVK